MAVRKIRKTWWVDFRFSRGRYRKRSPENSKKGAEAYEVTLRQKLARGESLDDLDKESKEQNFEEFARKWLATYVKNNNKISEATCKKYTLQTHLIPFFGQTPVGKITALQIEEFKAKKINEGLVNKTVNNHLTVLGTCLRTAQEWLELKKIPRIKKLKTPPQKFDFLLPEESELLLANSQGMYREIIFTALKTGLRRGELKGLRWSDVDWINHKLTISHSWCEFKNGLDSPKSNKTRHIPLTDELYEMLNRRKQKSGFIFPNFNNRKLSQEINNACKKSGIREITCHTLRHTFASHLTMAGAPLKAIQELLGHANIQTTMIYAHLAPSSLRETINLLEPKRLSIDFGQQAVNNVDNFLPVAVNKKISNRQ